MKCDFFKCFGVFAVMLSIHGGVILFAINQSNAAQGVRLAAYDDRFAKHDDRLIKLENIATLRLSSKPAKQAQDDAAPANYF